jgi:hypothetical protein
MYTLVQTLGFQAAMKREFGPLFVAFMIAEFFYKFKSFALECVAFLVTWAILSFLQSLVIGKKDEPAR